MKTKTIERLEILFIIFAVIMLCTFTKCSAQGFVTRDNRSHDTVKVIMQVSSAYVVIRMDTGGVYAMAGYMIKPRNSGVYFVRPANELGGTDLDNVRFTNKKFEPLEPDRILWNFYYVPKQYVSLWDSSDICFEPNKIKALP